MADETASPAANHPLWIDQRLDQIEGALLGVLPRQERLSLLAGIESRLVKLAGENPDLESAASQKLEAPELASSQAVTKSVSATAKATPSVRRSRMAFTSGVLGIIVLVLMIFSPVIYTVAALASELSESMGEIGAIILLVGLVLLLAFGGLAAVVMGIVSLVKISRSQKKLVGTGWAITGLCTGPMPMFAGALGMLIFLPLVAELPEELLGMNVSYNSSPQVVVSNSGDCSVSPYPAPAIVSPSTASLPAVHRVTSVESTAYALPESVPQPLVPAAVCTPPATAVAPVPLTIAPLVEAPKFIPNDPVVSEPAAKAPQFDQQPLGEAPN